MPIFRNRMVLEIVRNVKVFLNLDAGVTRGQVPELQPYPAGADPQTRKEIEQLRERLRAKEAELSRLRKGTANAAALAQGSPNGGPPKFFVVGRSKSGTSWLMRLLDSHPEIFCRGEGKFFGKDQPKSLHNALARSKELQIWLNRNPWTWRDEDPDLQDLISVLVQYLMAEKLSKTKKRIVGDKTPLESLETIEDIATLCPGAKVVHIIRDGRDVAVSTVHHKWNEAMNKGGSFELSPEQEAKRKAYHSNPGAFGSTGESIFSDGQVEWIARGWRNNVERAMRDGPKLLGEDYYQLHYEDLLVEPVAEARRILEFLDADSSEKVARKCVEAVSFEKLANRKPGEEDSTSFYRKGVSGDWKGILTKEDRQIFKEEAGDLLVELGYERDDDW